MRGARSATSLLMAALNSRRGLTKEIRHAIAVELLLLTALYSGPGAEPVQIVIRQKQWLLWQQLFSPRGMDTSWPRRMAGCSDFKNQDPQAVHGVYSQELRRPERVVCRIIVGTEVQ